MLLIKCFYIFLLKSRHFFNKGRIGNKTALFISLAGIGDSIYLLSAIQFYFKITQSKVDVLVLESSNDVFLNQPCVNKIHNWNNDRGCINSLIDFNDYEYIISNRSNLPLLKLIYFNGFSNYFINNPSYESLRIISRIKCKLSSSYRKRYFSENHAGLLMSYEIGNFFKVNELPMKPLFSEKIPTGKDINSFLRENAEYGILHVAGQDDIRKLDSALIKELISNINVPLILLGSSNDLILYSEIQSDIQLFNGIGCFSLNEVYYLLKRSKFCIAPDSAIMHLASLTDTKVIGIMGNALEQTFGPVFSRNKTILTRNPSCSPCSKQKCTKFSGHSCVQDITSFEIIKSI